MHSLPDHLTQILALLGQVIDRILAPGPRTAAQGPSLHQVLGNRLVLAARRFARLYALWRANRLPPPRPARPRALAAQAADTPARAPMPRPRLSRARAWLVHRGGHHAAAATGQFEAWMARPDLPEFLAAVPRAGRYLRPLAHMLGATLPPFLRLPPRPRAPRRSRPARARPALHGFTPPLPPNVIAAARAWKNPPAARANRPARKNRA